MTGGGAQYRRGRMLLLTAAAAAAAGMLLLSGCGGGSMGAGQRTALSVSTQDEGLSAEAGQEEAAGQAKAAAGQEVTAGQEEAAGQAQLSGQPSSPEHVPLLYAEQFSLDRYPDGSTLITIAESGQYLVIPEDVQGPGEITGQDISQASAESLKAKGLPEEVTVIRLPLKNIYLAATSAMDLFAALNSVGQITLSGTESSGWYVEAAREAMEAGRMVYAGKYSAPDYEQILSMDCDLAIESTMINHSPQVKEQLERLGIPVLVERSSYESHPLGRMEWIKLYGVLTGQEELAQKLFDQEISALAPVLDQEPSGKTVAFFYITSSGAVNVRKSGDYVAKMISLSGGSYIPEGLGNDNALSTMNMQMEAFYAAAKDADYLIYNSTIDGELATLDEFLQKSSLLKDFKAVKEGHVWCARKNMFQETMSLGDMILDINRMLTKEDPPDEEMHFLRHLE